MLGAPHSLSFFAQRRHAVFLDVAPTQLLQPGVEAHEAFLSSFRPFALGPLHVVIADDGEKEEPSEAQEIHRRSFGRNEPVRGLQTEDEGNKKDDELARERER